MRLLQASRFWQAFPFTWKSEAFTKKPHLGKHHHGYRDEGLRETRLNTFSEKIALLSNMWDVLVTLI